MNRKFRFVKSLEVEGEGRFKAGDEITILNNRVFFNDGMVQPAFYDLLLDLVEYEIKNGFNYLREVSFPQPVNFR